MSYVLDTVVTDQYQELKCPGTRRVTLQIAGGAVLIGFGVGTRAAVYGTDEPFLPITGGIARRCDAIRIKNRTPGTVGTTAMLAGQP
jgi:hypothetical protein